MSIKPVKSHTTSKRGVTRSRHVINRHVGEAQGGPKEVAVINDPGPSDMQAIGGIHVVVC